MKVWFLMVGFVSLTSKAMMQLVRLLTLDVGGSDLLSLMLVVIFLVSVVDGILLFLIFIGSSVPLPGLLLNMMGMMVLLLILWSGPLVLCRRGNGLAMLPGPPVIWTGVCVDGLVAVISAEDVAHWPYWYSG